MQSTNIARREMRKALHVQLDHILNAETALPDGSPGSVLDDLCVRNLVHGCGVAVRLAAVPPEIVEAPAPLVEVVGH